MDRLSQQWNSYITRISSKFNFTNDNSLWTKYRIPISIVGGITLITAAHYLIDKIHRKINKYPPGSSGLPFIGSLLYMTNEAKFFSWLANSSPISMIYLLRGKAVILHDPSIIQVIFTSGAYRKHVNDRVGLIGDLDPRVLTIADLHYDKWIARRKLWHNALFKTLNKKHLDKIVTRLFSNMLYNKISDQTDGFTKSWTQLSQGFQYFQFYLLFESSFGVKFDNINGDDNHDDIKKQDELTQRIEKFCDWFGDHIDESLNLFGFVILLKLMKFEPQWVQNWGKKRIENMFHDTSDTMKNFINQNSKYDTSNVEHLLNNIDKNDPAIFATMVNALKDPSNHTVVGSDAPKSKKSGQREFELNLHSFHSIMSDFRAVFIAGLETTSNTMHYIITQFAKQLKLQRIIYDELINYIKQNNIQIEKHKNKSIKTIDTRNVDFKRNLPYLCAFVYECLRLSSVARVGIPHATNADISVTFEGKEYNIPKNSMLMLDIVHANTKAQCWANEENQGKSDAFCLSHWLVYHEVKNDKDGVSSNNKKCSFKYNNNFVGFSVGRRDCVGKTLAQDVLFRLTLLFILNFQIYGPNGKPKEKGGATTVDIDQSVQFKYKYAFTRSIETVPIKLEPRV